MAASAVTVWGENRHEQIEAHVAERYPTGMHGAIADGIRENLGDWRGCGRPPSTSPNTA